MGVGVGAMWSCVVPLNLYVVSQIERKFHMKSNRKFMTSKRKNKSIELE